MWQENSSHGPNSINSKSKQITCVYFSLEYVWRQVRMQTRVPQEGEGLGSLRTHWPGLHQWSGKPGVQLEMQAKLLPNSKDSHWKTTTLTKWTKIYPWKRSMSREKGSLWQIKFWFEDLKERRPYTPTINCLERRDFKLTGCFPPVDSLLLPVCIFLSQRTFSLMHLSLFPLGSLPCVPARLREDASAGHSLPRGLRS